VPRKPCLTLSTIHRAKGLGWLHVRIVDLIEGRFPHSKNPDQDEELRVFYVAVTRAKRECVLSYAPNRRDKESTFIELARYTLRIITTS